MNCHHFRYIDPSGKNGGIQAVLFDLGNVIFPFSHNLAAEKIGGASPLSDREIFRRIFDSGLEARFDRGLLSPKEFYRELKKILSLDMTYEEFTEAWNNIFSLNENVIDLIHNLKQNGYPVYILSNTNVLHFDYLRKIYPFLETLDGFFLSFEIGMRKPDRRIFEHAVSGIGTTARAIVYIDDKPEYVTAAEEVGLRAILFDNADGLRRSFQELGINLRG